MARPLADGLRLPSGRVIATPSPEEQAERDRQRQEQAKREREEQRLQRAQWLWEHSDVPPRYLAADLRKLGDVPPAYKAVADQLLNLPKEPKTIGMLGTRGTGKTDLASGLIKEFCRAGRSARYATAMGIFQAIRKTFGSHGQGGATEADVVEQLARADLLVVDELQTRSDSIWENGVLVDLIDRRYASLRSTVLVANLTPDAFAASVGESIASRITESGGLLICTWPSFRQNGKARPATAPVWDLRGEKYEYPPVMEGAKPTRLRAPTFVEGN